MTNILKIFFLSTLFLATILPQTKYSIELKTETRTLPFRLTEVVPKEYPKVALALSGGGARGLSQIGVLEALQEYGIHIDYIVGTSMGSVVGGLFSAGYTSRQMDSIANNTNWEDLLGSSRESNRRDLFVDQKVTEDKAIFSLRLNGLTPILPTSINTGQRLSNFLNLLTLQAPVHANDNFNNLLYKYKAVCTDLVTGKQIVLDKGSLSQAMRASSSVSFLLSPVKMDSLILVDGGLIANVPVNVAAKEGNFVIAVNATSPLHDKQQLQYPWNVADQIVSIPMKILNGNQLKDANFVLTPELGDITATDFSKADSLVEFGYRYAVKKMPALKKEIDSSFVHNLLRGEKALYIKGMLIETDSSGIGKEFVAENGLSDSVSNIEIQEFLARLLNSGNYKNVKATVELQGNICKIQFDAQNNPDVRKVSVKGINLFRRGKIDSIFSSLINRPFNSRTLIFKIIKVINLYRDKGYSLAALDSLNFNKDTGKLLLVFDEGLISNIKIEGNKYTNSSVIERELPFKKGDHFLYNNVSDGLVNLTSTNLFSDIVLLVNKKGAKDNIVVRVSEKPSSLMRVGFRVDNEDKALINLDLRDENLFGTGAELGLNLIAGARNRAYTLEQKSNRIFNTYLTYRLDAFYKFNDFYNFIPDSTGTIRKFSYKINGEYRQIYYGGSVGLGTQAGKFGNLIFEGNYEFEQLKNIQNNTQNPLKTKVVSLKISTTIDTQDKYPYPTKGVYFNGYYETAQKILGGQVAFSNIGFDYKSHITINGVSTFTPRIMMGFADKTMPITEEYSLGGQDMFFGMRKDESRGKQIFLTSLEYRYKLPVKIFFDTYVSARYDLGSIWPERDDIRFKDLRDGIGATISFNTPVGPADFSVGKSFKFIKNLPENPISWGDTVFYFSIGYYY